MGTKHRAVFEKERRPSEPSVVGRLSMPVSDAPPRNTRANSKTTTRSQSPRVRVPFPTRINNKEVDAEEPISDELFDRLKRMHKNCMKKSTAHLTHAESAVRRLGLEEAVLKEITFFDVTILWHVLKHINETRGWSLNRVHQLLPRIKDALTDTECSLACLDALRQICGEMLDKVIIYAENQPSIGVDVAAEDRQKKANDCIKILRHLCSSREDYYKKMSVDDVDQLDVIMMRLKHLGAH